MSNLDDFKPYESPSLAGIVDYQQGPGGPQDNNTAVPGSAIIGQDIRFTEDQASTRYGTETTMSKIPVQAAATGIDVLEVLGEVNPGQIPVVFDDIGELLEESPAGSGAMVSLTPPFPLPVAARMTTTQANNRLYMAFHDGKQGLRPPLVLSGLTGLIGPVSQNVVGALWLKGNWYLVGDLVRSLDGRWWLCTVSGTGPASAAGPVWPTRNGFFSGSTWTPANATDLGGGNSSWTEWTPNCTAQLPAPDITSVSAINVTHPGGTISGGLDVYIKFAWVIPETGEGPRSAPIIAVNTPATGNNQIEVQFNGGAGGPAVTRWLAELNLQPTYFNPFLLNVYVASVATGATAPSDAAYGLYSFEQSVGTSVVITSIASTPGFSTNIVAISRASGVVTAQVNSNGGFAAGRAVTASGVTDGSFNADYTVQSVYSTPVYSGSPTSYAIGSINRINNRVTATIFSSQSTTGSGSVVVSSTFGFNGSFFATFVKNSNGTISASWDQSGINQSSGGGNLSTTAISTSSKSYVTMLTNDLSAASSSGGTLTVFTSSGKTYPQNAGFSFLTPSPPPAFQGQNGTRYMIVLREDPNGSISPVDPDSPIAVSFQGLIASNILTINRDSSGNVQATVVDITGFSPGQSIIVEGCTGDTTFNGSRIITGVQGTLAPEGIISWVDISPGGASNDETGTVVLPAGPAPIAFLPPGSTNDILDIAAFSEAGGSGTQTGKGGPFFYISKANPTPPISVPVISMSAAVQVSQNISSISRSTGGEVQIIVPNIAGFAPGQLVTVSGCSGDPTFNEVGTLNSVEPTSGTAGVLGYISANTDASSDTTGQVSAGNPAGSVIAQVSTSAGLAAGQVIAVQGTSNSDFNTLGTIASIAGNQVTLVMQASGTTTGGTMIVQQNLPTTSASGIQPITSITRDGTGNVEAQVPNLGGWDAGHLVTIAGVNDSTYNGMFELVSATLNPDGFSGVLGWQQLGQSAGNSTGGTAESLPDIVINYDDSFLLSNADLEVTQQLSSAVAPMSADLCWLPSLSVMAYTNGLDNKFYFSQFGDPANLSAPSGALGITDKKNSLAVAVRELQSGEIVALKTDGGFNINVSDLPPAQWNTPRRWEKHGPPCGAAIGVGSDFLVFPSIGEDSGAYLYKSGSLGLDWVSKEFSKTWQRVNWSAASVMWTEVDEESKEVHFGVPLDGATQCTHELVLNYEAGWEFPEQVNRQGKTFITRGCRKWSIWTIASKTAKVVSRDLATLIDSRINNRQFLRGNIDPGVSGTSPIIQLRRFVNIVTAIVQGTSLGSTTRAVIAGVFDPSFNGTFDIQSATDLGDGTFSVIWTQPAPDAFSGGGTFAPVQPGLRITMTVPDQYDDDGSGIPSLYAPAFTQEGTAIIRFGGYRAEVGGVGILTVTPITDDSTVQFMTQKVKLIGTKTTNFERGLRIDNEFVTLLYSNNGQPGNYFILQKHVLYGKPYQSGRRTR